MVPAVVVPAAVMPVTMIPGQADVAVAPAPA
jgi:hypothetical protein